MNWVKQYILKHISHIPIHAEQSVGTTWANHLKAIRKRRVGVKRLRTIERMLKRRWKLLSSKMFTTRYRTAWTVRSLGLMLRRIDKKRREEAELPLREALITYTSTELEKARSAFDTARNIPHDTPETVFHTFTLRSDTTSRTIKRCRGSSIATMAAKYATRQMRRISQECAESHRAFAYEHLHSIRKRVKHCMYIAQMLDDKKLRKRSATINWMLWERNDRSEFAEFVITASKNNTILIEYGRTLRKQCEQEANEIFTHLQEYVRM
jgi:hypothetical protein